MSWVKATHTDSSPHRPIFVNLSTVKTLQRSATEASTIVKFIDGTTLAVTEEPDALLKDA
jgi:endonuclease YncB( thermonuclease family)